MHISVTQNMKYSIYFNSTYTLSRFDFFAIHFLYMGKIVLIERIQLSFIQHSWRHTAFLFVIVKSRAAVVRRLFLILWDKNSPLLITYNLKRSSPEISHRLAHSSNSISLGSALIDILGFFSTRMTNSDVFIMLCHITSNAIPSKKRSPHQIWQPSLRSLL